MTNTKKQTVKTALTSKDNTETFTSLGSRSSPFFSGGNPE